MPHLRHIGWFFGGGLLAAVLLALLGPLQLNVTVGAGQPANAAVPADLPTGTPFPATATSAPPATATPATTVQPAAQTATPTTPPVVATEEPTAPPATVRPTERPRRVVPPVRTEEPTSPPPASATPAPTAPPDSNIVLVKRVDRPTALVGDAVSFTLEAHNRGTQPAGDVVISDAVPAAFDVTDLSSSKGDVVVDGQLVTAYPVLLAPGERISVTITARVRAGATGTVENIAVITTSSVGDDPRDNSDSAIVTIGTAPAARAVAARLPITAAPQPAPGMLAMYWPLLVLALGGLCFGIAMRRGVLRPAVVNVSLGTGATSHSPATLDLDADVIIQRWRTGATLSAISAEASQANPHVNPLIVAQAVQQIISAAVQRGGA